MKYPAITISKAISMRTSKRPASATIRKGPLFRAALGRTGKLSNRPLSRTDVWYMIQRRAADAKLETSIGWFRCRGRGGDTLRFMATPRSTRDPLFLGRWFQDEIIVVAVRWYLAYPLSYRQVCEMLLDRGVSVAPSTVMRWVIRYAPEFEKRWRRYEKAVGLSWRVDETYIKVAGEWTYLYRAVDQNGKTVDFFLSQSRDVRAAKTLFRHALLKHGDPLSITLYAYAAFHRALRELKASGEIYYHKMRIRSCAYLNNVVEQDHRQVKSRVQPMLGFQSFTNARVVIAGIEFAQKIKKRQYDLRRLGGVQASPAQLWQRALAA
jgi:transposase-like protein